MTLRALNVNKAMMEEECYADHKFRFDYAFNELTAIVIRRMTKLNVLVKEVTSMVATTRSFEH